MPTQIITDKKLIIEAVRSRGCIVVWDWKGPSWRVPVVPAPSPRPFWESLEGVINKKTNFEIPN